jgi:hypothetical protein
MRTITIIGQDFKPGATVTFGGTAAKNITVVSDTIITCTPPAHAAGTVDIVITNPDGGTYTKTGFTYQSFTIFKPEKEYEIKVNNLDITDFGANKYTENNELNIIDGYDFAFDGVDAEMPLEFRENIQSRATLEIFRNDTKVYKGYLSERTFDFKRKRLEVKSLPMTDFLNKYVAAFDLALNNPAQHIKYFFETYLPEEYLVGNIISQSNVLAGINVSLDTDVDTANVKALIDELCESYDIGIYNDGLTINAFAVPAYWPKQALDIAEKNYLITQPTILEKTDKYYDKVLLTYKTASGAAEATATAGTGDLVLEYSLSNTFCTAAVAAFIAARKLSIANRYYYTFEAPIIKDAIIKLADYFEYDDYIFVTTGIEKSSKTEYKLTGIGVLK